MNELKIFENEEFGSLRTMEIDGKIYFIAKDVAEALGYSKPRNAISMHCRYALKQGIPHPQNPDKILEVTFIPESDIYRLIAHSKLPNAVKFESWVFDDVLPSIRQYGAYLTPDTLEKAILNPDFIIQLATSLKEYQEENKNLKRENQTMFPKAEFYDEICDRNLLTNFRDTAKELKVKEKEFIKWLEDNKYIYRDNRNNIKPYSQYCVEPKRFFDIKDYKTDKFTGQQTFVTILGKNEFRIKLIEEDKNNE